MSKANTLHTVKEIVDLKPTVEVLEHEYRRLLGYPADYEPNERSTELSTWARQWYASNGRPWLYARLIENIQLEHGKVIIEGTAFNSPRLFKTLHDASATKVWVVAVSAGKACEDQAAKRWQEGKPDEYFFMEMLGSAVVENLVVNAGARFCAWADEMGLAILPHYSPGYPDWDVSEQQALMDVIKHQSGNFPGKIEVLHSGMLNPKKSLLGVFGVTENKSVTDDLRALIPCESCSLPACQFRRKPFLYAPNSTSEEISQIQEQMLNTLSALDGEAAPVLDQNASYNLSKKVLSKWAEERLEIEHQDDGTINALFRFEGTTCSNLGQTLLFDYQVRLDSCKNDYKITSLKCKPSAQDIGHKSMCEYIKRHRMFLDQIAQDRPMLNKPLNEVLAWQRENRSTGCFCDPTARLHKWGMVLEVLHYALAKKQD